MVGASTERGETATPAFVVWCATRIAESARHDALADGLRAMCEDVLRRTISFLDNSAFIKVGARVDAFDGKVTPGVWREAVVLGVAPKRRKAMVKWRYWSLSYNSIIPYRDMKPPFNKVRRWRRAACEGSSRMERLVDYRYDVSMRTGKHKWRVAEIINYRNVVDADEDDINDGVVVLELACYGTMSMRRKTVLPWQQSRIAPLYTHVRRETVERLLLSRYFA